MPKPTIVEYGVEIAADLMIAPPDPDTARTACPGRARRAASATP